MRIALLLLVSALVPCALDAKPKRAKNIILLIADAGGVPTLHAASIHGYNAPQKLFVQSWPHVGLSDTSPVGRWVSDSAAGMTAIVTGQKTLNGVISQGPDAVRGKSDGAVLKTILEHAEERGLSTGVISNVTITDATPGACYAHVSDRRMWGEIILQLLHPRFGDGVDILAGPGRQAIYDRVQKLGKELDAVAQEKGRPIYPSLAELPFDAKRGIVIAGAGFDIDEASRRAVRALSQNKKGFFLMIESDAHTNQPEDGLNRLVAFDKLIREIAQMVNLEETLLLFTADHSFDLRIVGDAGPDKPLLTGIEEWKQAGGKPPVRLPALRIENAHTAEEVPVAAIGPGAEQVRGFFPNTRLFQIMMDAWGWR